MDSIALDAPPAETPSEQRKAETRHLRPSDIPQICDLFAEIFRKGQTVRRQPIEDAFRRTYLTSPGDRLAPASLVDISADGRIQGFLGIITMSALLRDEPLRGGILGNFMASEANRTKSAMRLIRKVHSLDLDFLFTDTANRTSIDLGRAAKHSVLPLNSLEWVKVLRPCETASYLLGRRWPVARSGLGPLARTIDRMIGRPASPMACETRAKLVDRPIDAETFAARAPALIARFSLRPDWAGDEMHWLLAQAAMKTRNGPLHRREILNAEGKTIGLYLLYAKKGSVAHALQILTCRHHEFEVFSTLFDTAHALGAVAVRGPAYAGAIEALIRHRQVFYHHASATQFLARRPALKEAFLSPDNCLGGLFGESWTQLSTEDFA